MKILKLKHILNKLDVQKLFFILPDGKNYIKNSYINLTDYELDSFVEKVNPLYINCYVFPKLEKNMTLNHLKFKDEFIYEEEWYQVEKMADRKLDENKTVIPIRKITLKNGEKVMDPKTSYLFPLTRVDKIIKEVYHL